MMASGSYQHLPHKLHEGEPVGGFESAEGHQAFARILSAARSLQSFFTHALKVHTARRLLVTDTVSLGEKRFLHIVKVDGFEYLIGGGTASVSLLAELGHTELPSRFEEAIQTAIHHGPGA